MGCGGSKAVRTKTAPAPVPVQPQTAAQPETNASQQRQQPEGKLTEETTATEGQQETQEKPETVEEDIEGPVTKEQISLVQETWGLVKSDLEQVGVEFYIRLFKENPDLLQLFSFKDIDNSTEDVMRTDDRLKRQGLVTMQHVDLAVASLNDLGSIVPALKDLGARHTMYKVEEHHFALVGGALLDTLDKGLGEKFTAEVKVAWTVVYGIVADTMKAGMKEALEA
ncbi:hypothetical protein OS493_012745 [Desmophyllum pertusum]|uniref:Globin domain-containing protein n=1 Tax=Desmophyllum pertusum TaxID=174260 RepID=A0A9W9ZE14_9CNID|nr:hypothetical protein OS493_012745 [Desmophyllum pertusum]